MKNASKKTVNQVIATALAHWAKAYPAEKARFDAQLTEFPVKDRAKIREAAISGDVAEVYRLARKSLPG